MLPYPVPQTKPTQPPLPTQAGVLEAFDVALLGELFPCCSEYRAALREKRARQKQVQKLAASHFDAFITSSGAD